MRPKLNRIICETCGEHVDERKLEQHMKKCHKEKAQFVCEICSKRFSAKGLLMYHLAHHDNARSYKCVECPKAFNTKADLPMHKTLHDLTKDPVNCEVCGESFQIRRKFRTHMRRMHNVKLVGDESMDKQIKCVMCEQVLPSMTLYNHHMKSEHKVAYSSGTVKECPVCKKSFTNLERHYKHIHG
jgi:hypothetical protein